MKNKLVRVIRQFMPSGVVRGLEEVYRRARIWWISMEYGFPARSLKIIAITGTNGKTTTAYYLNEILKAAGLKTALFSTAIIEIKGERKINDLNATVPLTSELQAFFKDAKQAKVDWVILETTSHALHQHKLDGVPFEMALMTNLTQDHLDYHKTMEKYAEAKGRLFATKPRYIVLNHDDKWFDYFNQFTAREQKITYGVDKQAECRIIEVNLHKDSSDIKYLIDHQTTLNIKTSLPGKFNVYNATAAVAAAYMLHIDLSHITQGVSAVKAVPGRLERVDVGKPYDVIVDYAHTPDALQQLLETLKHLSKGRIILVFGATGDRDKGKRPIMGQIAAKLADRILLTDEENYTEDAQIIRTMVMDGIKFEKAEAKTEEIADRREAIKKALTIARSGDTVLITGMGHEQYRIINGERVAWNDTEVVKELVAEKSKSAS